MLGIKKQLIKSMIKLEVVGNTPGKLQIYVAQLKKIDDEYKHYQAYAENAISLLKGINDFDVDYQKGIVTINYDTSVVNAQQIYRWLQVIVDIGIDYYEELKSVWDKEGEDAQKVEEIWQRMRPILVAALAKI
ncbi:MAG: hypothetical protein E7231_07370 [Cellulosilyticum sp.]|nr:hypothetical protein [Cellulosilyticum sp.]